MRRLLSKRLSKIFWWILIILFFSVPANGKEPVSTGPVDFSLEPILSSEWVCYIQDGDLYLRRFANTPIKIKNSKETGITILSPSLGVLDKSVFVAWIEQSMGSNTVKFASVSHDKKEVSRKDIELTNNTKVKQIRLFKDDKDRLYLLELFSDEKPKISINLSLDRGNNFKKAQLDVSNLEFLHNLTPVVVNDRLYLFFSGSKQDKTYIEVMILEIPSMILEEYKVLKEIKGVSFIESLKVNDKPLVIYKTSHENMFIIEGFIKKDTLYEAISLKELEGLDVARMDYHAWEDGRILIVFSGEEKDKFKQRIYAAVSEDEGKNWNVSRIDKKEFDNTRAWLPRMAVDGNKVAVVWEDSRDIRSGIRLKLSPDRGKTWMEKDTTISSTKNYAFRPGISFSKEFFYFAWVQFRDDERNAADLAMLRLKWDDAVKIASKKERGISLKKKEALLRERVKAYWKGMIKKDLKTTYEIHDPFYKARIPFDYYSAHRGPMVYHSYNIEDLKIEGNEATVKIKVKYEVPKIIILGKETFMPPNEITAEDTYLFIDGTWYRKFVDAMSGGSAIDY